MFRSIACSAHMSPPSTCKSSTTAGDLLVKRCYLDELRSKIQCTAVSVVVV